MPKVQTSQSRPGWHARRLLVLMTISSLVQVPAQAQQAGGDRPPATAPALEHVLIIGEKVERPYLETFSSVGVVTSEDLERYDIYDTQDAYRRLANVRAFADPTGSNSIAIRGLNADGVTQPSNSAALISVIVDGVTQSVEGLKRGSRGLWDIEQLEVHRGPQSTIQGRNALAGAVVIKSKDPTFEPEYRFRGLYGDLDRAEGAIALSGPVIEDELALRLSGEYAEKTSDIDFTDSANESFADDQYYNIRGKALYQPQSIDALEVLLSINHVHDEPASSPVSGPDFFDRVFAADSTFVEFRQMTADNYNADIAFDVQEGLLLRSITSYYDSDLEISSVPGSPSLDRDDHREDGDFTQEFRVEMAEGDSRVSGVAGLFYGSFEQDVDSYILYYNSLVVQDGTFHNETETWAAYADLRYRFTDRLSLIAGGRYQDDRVKNAANLQSDLGDQVSDRKADFDEFLPKLGLSLDLTPNQSLGLTASKGYRQGFAEARFGDESDIETVDPEYLWAYEIAYRVSALDNRLLLGANVFYNDYQDQQIAVDSPEFPGFVYTDNAGDSESWGLELETQYNAGNGFTAYASLGLLKTELGDFDDVECDGGSCSGNEFSEAPEVTGALGGSYQHSSGLFISLATNYTGEFYRNIANGDDLEVDDVFLVDTMIGYQYHNYRVSLYVDNVFDEDYLTGITFEPTATTPGEATVGDGRAWGVDIQAEF